MEGKRQEKEVTEESRAEGDLEEKNKVETTGGYRKSGCKIFHLKPQM